MLINRENLFEKRESPTLLYDNNKNGNISQPRAHIQWQNTDHKTDNQNKINIFFPNRSNLWQKH